MMALRGGRGGEIIRVLLCAALVIASGSLFEVAFFRLNPRHAQGADGGGTGTRARRRSFISRAEMLERSRAADAAARAHRGAPSPTETQRSRAAHAAGAPSPTAPPTTTATPTPAPGPAPHDDGFVFFLRNAGRTANQLLALDVAMRIALALNRTLIVPRHEVRSRWEGFPELYDTAPLRAAGFRWVFQRDLERDRKQWWQRLLNTTTTAKTVTALIKERRDLDMATKRGDTPDEASGYVTCIHRGRARARMGFVRRARASGRCPLIHLGYVDALPHSLADTAGDPQGLVRAVPNDRFVRALRPHALVEQAVDRFVAAKFARPWLGLHLRAISHKMRSRYTRADFLRENRAKCEDYVRDALGKQLGFQVDRNRDLSAAARPDIALMRRMCWLSPANLSAIVTPYARARSGVNGFGARGLPLPGSGDGRAWFLASDGVMPELDVVLARPASGGTRYNLSADAALVGDAAFMRWHGGKGIDSRVGFPRKRVVQGANLRHIFEVLVDLRALVRSSFFAGNIASTFAWQVCRWRGAARCAASTICCHAVWALEKNAEARRRLLAQYRELWGIDGRGDEDREGGGGAARGRTAVIRVNFQQS